MIEKYYCKNCKSEIKLGTEVQFTVKKKFEEECQFCGLSAMSDIPDYETPRQYEQRTGKPIFTDTAVWFRIPNDPSERFLDWELMIYEDALQYECESEEADEAPIVYIVIADPPVPPPDNWRPQ